MWAGISLTRCWSLWAQRKHWEQPWRVSALAESGTGSAHRFGVLSGSVFQIACLLCVLLVAGPIGCAVAMLFAGGVRGAMSVSYMNLVLESCPHHIRSAHVAVGNIVVGTTAMIVPILGSRLVGAYGIQTIIAASLVMSLLAAGWIAWKVRDPRHIRGAVKVREPADVIASQEESV